MAANPQRTDLQAVPDQPVTAASGQPYGERGAQEAAQRAIPLPDLAAATVRPNEPIHAGMATGPGPSPAQAGIPTGAMGGAAGAAGPVTPAQDVSDFFRALFTAYPTDELADLIATLDAGK